MRKIINKTLFWKAIKKSFGLIFKSLKGGFKITFSHNLLQNFFKPGEFKPGEEKFKTPFFKKKSFGSPFGFSKTCIIVFLFSFFSYSSSGDLEKDCKNNPSKPGCADFIRARTQQILSDIERNRAADSRAEEDRQIERERYREERDRQEAQDDERKRKEANNALREQRREAKENKKDREQKCEQAEQDAKEALEKSQDKQTDLQEEFYDLEEKITDLEKQNTEGQEKINQALEDLKKTSNQNIQSLKDEMGRELQGVEGQIGKLEEALDQLYSAVEEAEEQRLTAFYARRKQENELYSACFSTALEKTEKEKLRFYQRKKSGALQKKHIGALAEGGKAQVRGTFSGRFNYFLNLCLNNQAALLQKKNQANEYKLMLEKLKRKEMRIEDKILNVKAKINNLKTQGKSEVLKKYKEKMAMDIKNFEQAYSSLTQNHQRNTAQIIQEIGKTKQQQATVLMNRAKAIPQQTKNQLMENQCQGLEMLNMFPTTPSAPGSGELFQLGGGGMQ